MSYQSVIIQKFRDAEAKLIREVGYNQWECILYVWSLVALYSLLDIFVQTKWSHVRCSTYMQQIGSETGRYCHIQTQRFLGRQQKAQIAHYSSIETRKDVG
jgi:hypothetical protein